MVRGLGTQARERWNDNAVRPRNRIYRAPGRATGKSKNTYDKPARIAVPRSHSGTTSGILSHQLASITELANCMKQLANSYRETWPSYVGKWPSTVEPHSARKKKEDCEVGTLLALTARNESSRFRRFLERLPLPSGRASWRIRSTTRLRRPLRTIGLGARKPAPAAANQALGPSRSSQVRSSLIAGAPMMLRPPTVGDQGFPISRLSAVPDPLSVGEKVNDGG